MTREEERYKEARLHQMNNPIINHGEKSLKDIQLNAYVSGAEWADNNPKSGLVSVDWVCDYLEQKYTEKACYYLVSNLINDLRNITKKAREESIKRNKIKTILELFISWNGENEAIDIANLDSAVDYIDQCINSEHSGEGLVDIQKVIDFISDNILDYIDVQTLGIEYSREFDKERFIQDFYKAMEE